MTDALTLADKRCKEYADLATKTQRLGYDERISPRYFSNFHIFCGSIVSGKDRPHDKIDFRFTPCFPSIIAFVAIV
jgi:hypothetical protein